MTSALPERSTLRRDQAAAVRERILDAAVAVIEAGEEPHMRAVAQAAQIGERTVYRYFASREELHAALLPVIGARASAPMADDVAGLPAYVRRLFTAFDANAQLTRALVTAAWAPMHMTRTANLRALRAIIDAGFPRAPAAARESATASLRVLYSAAAWAYLADCDYGLEASIRHVVWNTKVTLDALRRATRGGSDG
jgi:AcrR family transcriptional regulator